MRLRLIFGALHRIFKEVLVFHWKFKFDEHEGTLSFLGSRQDDPKTVVTFILEIDEASSFDFRNEFIFQEVFGKDVSFQSFRVGSKLNIQIFAPMTSTIRNPLALTQVRGRKLGRVMQRYADWLNTSTWECPWDLAGGEIYFSQQGDSDSYARHKRECVYGHS